VWPNWQGERGNGLVFRGSAALRSGR